MRILVTGATGHVGSQLVRYLRDKSVTVRAGVHDLRKAQGLAGGKVEVVHFDFEQVDTMEAAIQDVDKVYLLTPPLSVGDEMARRAIDVMLGLRIAQVVRQSVLNADQSPQITLTGEHRAVEEMLEELELPWTILRPNAFMSNLVGLAEGVRRQDTLYLPLGDGRVSYIAPEDIGDVGATVLTSDGHLHQAYELTGPQALSGEEIATIMSEVLGRTIRYESINDEQFRQALLRAGLPEDRVLAYQELNITYREGMAARVTDTVQRLTGHPPTAFRDWLRAHADAFRREGEEKAA